MKYLIMIYIPHIHMYWLINLTNHPFAFLTSSDYSLPSNQPCSLYNIIYMLPISYRVNVEIPNKVKCMLIRRWWLYECCHVLLILFPQKHKMKINVREIENSKKIQFTLLYVHENEKFSFFFHIFHTNSKTWINVYLRN